MQEQKNAARVSSLIVLTDLYLARRTLNHLLLFPRELVVFDRNPMRSGVLPRQSPDDALIGETSQESHQGTISTRRLSSGP